MNEFTAKQIGFKSIRVMCYETSECSEVKESFSAHVDFLPLKGSLISLDNKCAYEVKDVRFVKITDDESGFTVLSPLVLAVLHTK